MRLWPQLFIYKTIYQGPRTPFKTSRGPLGNTNNINQKNLPFSLNGIRPLSGGCFEKKPTTYHLRSVCNIVAHTMSFFTFSLYMSRSNFWTLSPMALDKRAMNSSAPGSIHPSNFTYILVDFYRNLDVSENSGKTAPKSSILIGISIINHPF